MPDRLLPRPAPADEIITLLRRPKSGFVVYPKYVPKRMVDGRARFMTKCDMLVGPCACGYTHNEQDGWVRETLQYQNLRFEPLILWGEDQQRGMVVEIPAYWKEQQGWGRPRCDVLVGQCTCGRIHSIQENWVKKQLRKHGAVILNLPQPEGTDVSEPAPVPASRRSLDEVFDRPLEDHVMRSNAPVPASRRSLDEVFDRPLEDRVMRSNPLSSTNWWTISTPPTPTEVPNLDISLYVNLDPPTELQERVDNAEGAIGGCDCTACESRRETERMRVLREWVQTAQAVRDTLDAEDSDAWARDNCNEQGYAPLFCDCEDCRNTRLSSRTNQTDYSETSGGPQDANFANGAPLDESSNMGNVMANRNRDRMGVSAPVISYGRGDG